MSPSVAINATKRNIRIERKLPALSSLCGNVPGGDTGHVFKARPLRRVLFLSGLCRESLDGRNLTAQHSATFNPRYAITNINDKSLSCRTYRK